MKTGSNNLIINCDSYENFDYMTGGTTVPDYGGNADGFADKQYTNTGTNTYKGCRYWGNSDDGWDLYEKIGNTTIDSCWCYANGPLTYDMTDNIRFKTDSAAWFSKFKNAQGRYVITNYGNGNGFKLGGNSTASNTLVRNCVAVANKVKGFDQNNNNGTMTIYNCTSYNNRQNYGFANSAYGALVIKNCASLTSALSNSFISKTVVQSNNSWNTGFSCVAADFISLEVNQLLNARQSNGSIPEIALLHLVPASAMIDKGANLGLPFSGSAPDLGAFEYQLPSATPQILFNNGISVYYSASQSQIFVQGEIASVNIYNVNGHNIFASYLNADQISISATNWGNGVFLVVTKSIQNILSSTKVFIQ